MKPVDDPFIPFAALSEATHSADDDFAVLSRRPASGTRVALEPSPVFNPFVPTVGRLHGFDLLEQPLVSQLNVLPGEVLAARSTVPLRRAQVGHEVLLAFTNGDARAPVILGVIEARPLQPDTVFAGAGDAHKTAVQVDDQRQLIEAEREVVLRCGEASITLTRAGKVIIKGNYILSRSTGYNKIKGAAIDIN